MLILHSYTDKDVQMQRETRKAIEKLKLSYRVISRKMVRNEDYYNFLCQYWDYNGPIINVEQDIVVSRNQITELRNCPHTHCTFPYVLGNSPLHKGKSCLFTWNPNTYWQDFEDSDKTPEFSIGSGVGLVKLELSIRKIVDIRRYPVDVYRWWYIDSWLSQALQWAKQKPWHCHYPLVKHNHELYERPAMIKG